MGIYNAQVKPHGLLRDIVRLFVVFKLSQFYELNLSKSTSLTPLIILVVTDFGANT